MPVEILKLENISQLGSYPDSKSKWQKSSFNKSLLAKDVIFLAVEQKRYPVAHLVARFFVDWWDILDIYVVDDARKKGIGSLLINKLKEHVDGEKILLEVDKGNINAQKLYFSSGFKAFSVRKDYYGKGRDALCMSYQPINR